MDLKLLNDSQRDAVTYIDSPLLVFAGAGSGKTKVIVNKIAYLILEKKILPSKILALTFTKKAADEMKNRVNEILDNNNKSICKKGMFVGTFHSWGAFLLRSEAEFANLDPSFAIFDSQDKEKILKDIIKSMNIDKVSPSAVGSIISKLKNSMINAKDYASKLKDSFYENLMSQIYISYEEKKQKLGCVDFDDLLTLPLNLLYNNEEILSKYRNRYDYILVDEYQDTNKVQYLLIKQIASKGICVVGDDDQSIYSWRGAEIQNIFDFQKDFKNVKVIKLDVNYRSTQNIIDAAYSVVSNNINREQKNIKSNSDSGESIGIYEAEDENDEALFVLSRVNNLVSQGKNLRDIAILYRTNAQSRVLEETFIEYNVPYRIFGGVRFYERTEVKDLMGYVSFLIHNDDDISLDRIINTPSRGIGPSKINILSDIAKTYDTSQKNIVYSYIHKCLGGMPFTNISKVINLSESQLKSLSFLNNLKFFSQVNVSTIKTVKEYLEFIIKSTNYDTFLKDKYFDTSEDRIENIDQLKVVTEQYSFDEKNILKLVEDVFLMLDTDISNSGDFVQMMSLHASKGLEFPTVFIVGVAEGTLPHFKSLESEKDIEEERRLFYVGMTRAKEKLFISWPRYSSKSFSYISPSRFVNEIPEELIFSYS